MCLSIVLMILCSNNCIPNIKYHIFVLNNKWIWCCVKRFSRRNLMEIIFYFKVRNKIFRIKNHFEIEIQMLNLIVMLSICRTHWYISIERLKIIVWIIRLFRLQRLNRTNKLFHHVHLKIGHSKAILCLKGFWFD